MNIEDDAILAQYERSQHLQQEWEQLRDALEQVDRSESDAPARLQAIRDRMAIITADMAAILHQTQAAKRANSGLRAPGSMSPTSAAAAAAVAAAAGHGLGDGDDGDPSALQPYRPPHFSARRRHIIQRTYSSTSDSSVESAPPAPCIAPDDIPILDSDDLDDQTLRRTLMRDAPNHPVITVEHETAARPRFHLSDLTRGFKDKLRAAASPHPSSDRTSAHDGGVTRNDSTGAAANPEKPQQLPEPVDLAAVTALDDDDDDEGSNRSAAEAAARARAAGIPDDPLTPASVAHGLGAVSVGMDRKVGSMSRGVAADAMMPATVHALPSAASGVGAADHGGKTGPGPVSPVTNEGTDDEASPASANGADEADGGGRTSNHSNGHNHNNNPSSTTSSSSSSRRRKGWQAIDSKIKALGRLTVVRKSMARVGSSSVGGHSTGGGSGSDGGGGPADGHLTRMKSLRRRDQQQQHKDVFAETGERLAERGEKLAGVAEGAEQMASDANDMLAAVRALRERSQARGRFG